MDSESKLEIPIIINIPVDVIADALKARWDSRRLRCRIVEAKKAWGRREGWEPEKHPTHISFSEPGIQELCAVSKDDWSDPELFNRVFKDGPEFLIGSKFCGLIIEVDSALSYDLDFILSRHA